MFKPYGIGSADRGVIVVDSILTEAFAEDIGIGTVSSGKVVIARTADEGVVAVFSVQIVITRASVEGIITRAAGKVVITFATVEGVVAVSTV